eukprot:TRINITY_DN8683_c0_g1_i7.p1 TRINITY_DN8683_c0_g1~~TRINITY_DN8683_c0_g1_i7.p1  ORF type:complete len:310 (+),score=59.06 TRINITY_DN8683_c0_g1_i7:81-1010(+)
MCIRDSYYAACNVVAGVFAKVFDCPQGFQNISKAFVMIGTHILVPVVIGFGACGSDKFFLGNPHCGEITTYIFFFNLFGNIFIFAMGADYYQKDAAMKGASNTVNLPNYTELRENEYSGQETLLASQPPPPRVTTQYIIQNVLDRPMIASLVAAFLTLIPGLKGLLFAPGSPGGYFVGVIGEIGDFSADLTLLTAGIGVAEVLAENNMRFIIPKQYLYQLTIVKLIAVPLIGLLTLRFQKKHIGLSFKKDPVFQWTHMLMWMAPASGQNIAFAEENNYVKSEMKTLWMLQVICSIFSMSFVGILFFKYY